MKKILVIGGSDGSCGAGIFADHETLHALGSEVRVVVTAVTSQSHDCFLGSHAIPVESLKSQIQSISQDTFDAVKIGMLPTPGSVKVVGGFLNSLEQKSVVLDPVLSSSTGGSLNNNETILAMKELLFPIVDLVTPNLPEAKIIVGEDVKSLIGMKELAAACMRLGCKAVLLKGGHSEGEVSKDIYIEKSGSPVFFQRKRINQGTAIRGTGCRLASAIAHFFANSSSMENAVKEGVGYLQIYIKRKLALS